VREGVSEADGWVVVLRLIRHGFAVPPYHRCGNTISVFRQKPKIVPLPRNRRALSATGSACGGFPAGEGCLVV